MGDIVSGGGTSVRYTVSGTVRSVFEAHDPLAHQYWPVRMFHPDGTEWNRSDGWFSFYPRRLLDVDEVEREPMPPLGFMKNHIEQVVIPRVWRDPALLRLMASLPVWRLITNGEPAAHSNAIYVSPPIYAALRAAGVAGLGLEDEQPDFYDAPTLVRFTA